MTQSYSNVSSTSALSIRILSSKGALGRSYSSRVYFRELHHALRMYAPVDLDGQVGVVVDVSTRTRDAFVFGSDLVISFGVFMALSRILMTDPRFTCGN